MSQPKVKEEVGLPTGKHDRDREETDNYEQRIAATTMFKQSQTRVSLLLGLFSYYIELLPERTRVCTSSVSARHRLKPEFLCLLLCDLRPVG